MEEIKLTAEKFEEHYRYPWNTIDTAAFLDVSPKPFKVGQNILLTDGGGSARCLGVIVHKTIDYPGQQRGIIVTMRLP